MSDVIQDIGFVGSGLDTDTSNKFIALGDSPLRLHVMIGEDGLEGEIVIMKGNEKIAYTGGLDKSRLYFTHGGYYNELQRKVYYFVFSQPYLDPTDPSLATYIYDNRLLCFNEDSKTIDTIFIDTKNYFGLDPKKPIIRPAMLKDWLFINPVTSQPRLIDVTRAFNYTNYPKWDSTKTDYTYGDIVTFYGGLFVVVSAPSTGESPSTHPAKWDRIGDAYQDDSSVVSDELTKAFFALKTPPIDRITTSYGSDTTKNYNNVEGIIFRFCHRYQYFDDSYSTCSAYSNITLPVGSEAYNGQSDTVTTNNNYIKLYFSLYSAALVKKIEVFFQPIGGDWKLMTVINRQDQTLLDDVDYTFNFYNDASYFSIDEDIITTVESSLPRLAGSMEIINENVLCFGKCTEGFDNIDKDEIDVTLTPAIQAIDANIFYEGTIKRDNVSGGDITESATTEGGFQIYNRSIRIDTWFGAAGVAEDDIYKMVIAGQVSYKTLSASDVASAVALATAMASIMPMYATVTDMGGEVNINIPMYGVYISIDESFIYTPSAIITGIQSVKLNGFKTAAYHPFCIFYYDETLRRCSAQVVPEMSVYVPSVNEYSPPVSNMNYRWFINWSVNHTPPSWAKYWRWGYAGNSRCSYFVQYIVSDVDGGDAVVPNSIYVDITPLQTLKTTTTTNWNAYPNSNISAYEFTQGDRIRFITETPTDITASGTTLGATIDGVYDFEIIKFDDTTNKIYVQDFDFASAGIDENSLVEIYTPIKTDLVEFYYEFGNLYPVLENDGVLSHGGQIQNQVIGGQAATGTFTQGDVYHITRTPSKPLCTFTGETKVGAFHESMWWSDFYKSDDWDKGRSGIENSKDEVTVNIVRYSNPYFQGTEINGLTMFEETSKKEVTDVYGDIQAIIEVGDTLKVYQEKKATGILIGKTEYTDSEGQVTTPELSTRVLGSVRYPAANYGTIFPESIVKNNRYVYGFDPYNGVVWRDSPAGIFPISGRYAEAGGDVDYKMATYFKNKSKALLESGVDHINCIGVWDGENKMYVLSIKDTVNEENNDTIMFHEPSNRWITNADFTYQPASPYNQILELNWSIVKGFESGIGFSFDGETRFARFNIGGGLGTSQNINHTPLKVSFTTTVNAPTVTCGVDYSDTLKAMTIESPDPDVHISWVEADDYGKTFNAVDHSISDVQYVSITVVGSASCTLVSYPSWVTVLDPLNIPVSAGGTVVSEETLGIYPSANTGALRTGNLVFTDAYGNSINVVITQYAPVAGASVTVQVKTGETNLILYGTPSGTVELTQASVDISFTPVCSLYERWEEFTCNYTITNNAVQVGSGAFIAVNMRGNLKTVEMADGAEAGDVIVVNLFVTT